MRYSRGIARVFAGLLLAGLAAPSYSQAPTLPEDVPAANARLDTLLARGGSEDLAEAEAVYLRLLSRVGTPLTPQEEAVLDVHLARLALVLPAAVQARVADGDLQLDPAHAAFKAGAGEVLLAWWRSQDPLPATQGNERLEEHLRRAAFAGARYAHDERATGLDDRGEIYLRYGTPTRRKSITFTDPKLIDTVYQPGLTISPSDFPENEFWIYSHIDGTGYYLFVKDDGRFRLAETVDLLPHALQTGFRSSNRGEVRAKMALAVLRSVYRQLAVEHPDFGARYHEVDQFALLQEEAVIQQRLSALARQARNRDQASSRTDRSRDVAAQEDFGAPATVPRPNDQTPRDFVESVVYQGRSEDAQASWRRETSMPEQFTEVFRETEILPVAVRTARFLDDDGTTRTEVYWSPRPGALRVEPEKDESRRQPVSWSPDEFLVALTAVQQTPDYRERQVTRKPYLITDLPETGDAAIPAQTLVVRGDTGRYNLALQWDQYQVLVDKAGGMRVGPRVRVATARSDSLPALEPSPGVLEMSDLKPVYVRSEAELIEADGRDGAAGEPYPHADVWPGLPLGLYFEVYHMTFGPDDRTHYTVVYEIASNQEKSPLLRFLGQRKKEGIAAQTRYTDTNRTAREYILLDFSEWAGQGELEVRVRVTDETTGQQVARSLVFEMNG